MSEQGELHSLVWVSSSLAMSRANVPWPRWCFVATIFFTRWHQRVSVTLWRKFENQILFPKYNICSNNKYLAYKHWMLVILLLYRNVMIFNRFCWTNNQWLRHGLIWCGIKLVSSLAYLPGIEINHDQEGGFSRARAIHCTSDGLTSAISSNVGNSDAKFLQWGTAFALSLYSKQSQFE